MRTSLAQTRFPFRKAIRTTMCERHSTNRTRVTVNPSIRLTAVAALLALMFPAVFAKDSGAQFDLPYWKLQVATEKATANLTATMSWQTEIRN